MKIEVLKSELVNSLNLNNVVKQVDSISALENFKVCIKDSNILIYSTDLETLIQTKTNINEIVIMENEFLVNRKRFLNIINSFNDLSIQMIIDDDTLKIKGFQSSTSLPISREVNEFPDTEIDFANYDFLIDIENIYEIVKKACLFVGNDEMRPMMNGINLKRIDDSLNITATDAHKLFSEVIECDKGNDIDITVPVIIQKFMKLQGDGKLELFIDKDLKNIIVFGEMFNTRIRLFDGRFPNFEAVIPKNNNEVVFLNKAELTNALKVIKSSLNSTNSISFIFKGNNMLIISEDFDYSISSAYLLKIEDSRLTDEYTRIAVNYNFFTTALSIINHPIISLKFSQSNRPILIDTDTNRTILIMPVMITSNESADVVYEQAIKEIKNLRDEKIATVALLDDEDDDIMPNTVFDEN